MAGEGTGAEPRNRGTQSRGTETRGIEARGVEAEERPVIRLAPIELYVFQLQANVGEGVKSNPHDIFALKRRLIDLGFDWVKLNDKMDAETIQAIRLFRAITEGHHEFVTKEGKYLFKKHGLVEVGKRTYQWLQSLNAPRWQQMSEKGEGFENHDVKGIARAQRDYGTDWMAATIQAAGEHYARNYRDSHPQAALLTINDVSPRRGGYAYPHQGHQTGLDCDIRVPRKDGQAPGGVTWKHTENSDNSKNYDRDTMKAMLTAIRNQRLVTIILFNDPDLVDAKLCRADKKDKDQVHDNHAHFQIRPPGMEA